MVLHCSVLIIGLLYFENYYILHFSGILLGGGVNICSLRTLVFPYGCQIVIATKGLHWLSDWRLHPSFVPYKLYVFRQCVFFLLSIFL
jgi:hypothetical protein